MLTCPVGREQTLPNCNAELGFELEMYLPFAWWLHRVCGIDVHVSSCGDMSPFWWFAHYASQDCLRSGEHNPRFCSPRYGWYGRHSGKWNNCHDGISLLPGLSRNYSEGLMRSVAFACSHRRKNEKPNVFILNKYANEWGKGPANHINPRVLSPLLNDTNILYHRPDRWSREKDREEFLQWAEESRWLKSSRIADLASTSSSWDLRHQLCHMSRADIFIVSQGGGSRIAALFGKPTVVYHKKGSDNYAHIAQFTSNSRIDVVNNQKDIVLSVRKWIRQMH